MNKIVFICNCCCHCNFNNYTNKIVFELRFNSMCYLFSRILLNPYIFRQTDGNKSLIMHN